MEQQEIVQGEIGSVGPSFKGTLKRREGLIECNGILTGQTGEIQRAYTRLLGSAALRYGP